MMTRHSGLLDKKYWEFFMPTILMAMTSTMSIVVDSIIVGNMLGAHALAAVNLVLPIMMAYTTMAVLAGLGAATVISVAKGRRQNDYADDIFTTAVMFMVVFSLILAGGQALFLDNITGLLTRDAALRPLVRNYYQILLLGTPVIIIPLGLVYCLRVDGRVKLASGILIAANLANLFLDVLYMGPLKMGIAGSSLATVSGYVLGGSGLIFYFMGKDRTLRFHRPAVTHTLRSFKYIKTIFATGLPAAVSSSLLMAKLLAINTIVMAVAGKSGMVAFSVCISCLSLVSMFIAGAAQAMTPILGVLYGEKDYTGVWFVVKRASQVLMSSSVLIIAVLEIDPHLILQLFGVKAAEDMAQGIPAIRIFALSLAGTSISFLSIYYYMTIGHKKLSTAISIVQGFIVVVPAACFLSRIFGITGVWIAFLVAEISTLALIGICYKYLSSKHPETYRNILLLNDKEGARNKTLEATLTNTTGAASEILDKIEQELLGQNFCRETIHNVTEPAKEILNNIVSHAYGKNKSRCYIDLRLSIHPRSVELTVRDNGAGFDPLNYLETSKSNGPQAQSDHVKPSGLNRISQMAEINYSRIIGFNNTTLTIAT